MLEGEYLSYVLKISTRVMLPCGSMGCTDQVYCWKAIAARSIRLPADKYATDSPVIITWL